MSSEIISNIDLPISFTEQDMALLNMVDEQIERSLASGDVRVVLKFGRAIKRDMQVHGIALAKLLAKVEEHWSFYTEGGVDDEFVDVVYAEMGTPPSTTRKYVNMWKAIFDNNNIDENVKKQLLGRPIKTLLLLTAAANEGSINWDEILSTSTHTEVQEIVRAARGEATSSKNRIVITWKRDGTLVARRQEEVVEIGYLNCDDENEIGVKAIERIVSNSGIMEE